MASRNLVNLDAMIPREDFAHTPDEQVQHDNIEKLGLGHLKKDSDLLPLLRKPDFQRETNHWSPEQVVSLIECFVNGDLIPSVILWKSPLYLFVIDGGHRLSVLRSWVEDDYGDGPVSQAFFGLEISKEQRRIAKLTREMVADRIGKYSQMNDRRNLPDLPELEKRRLATLGSRALHIQWVTGNAEKAEASFFKINTEGTPLDDVEELLLRNRKRPIPIAARAIIRAGKGHRYWSQFESNVTAKIEQSAHSLHGVLFEPEVRRPLKTLDLPLGGSKGMRIALQILIDFMLIANRGQDGKPTKLEEFPEDENGALTTAVLAKSRKLAGWITGNDDGSLGLHPAIYFYGPTGVHSGPMFMGTVSLIGRKLSNNDQLFFQRFTAVRSQVEELLLTHKDLIATILQRLVSKQRSQAYEKLLDKLIEGVTAGEEIKEGWIVDAAGLTGKIVAATAITTTTGFSEATKSQAYLKTAIAGMIKCNICAGYLDPQKSLSYDHKMPKREGGKGSEENLAFAHPYCNQSVKQ